MEAEAVAAAPASVEPIGAIVLPRCPRCGRQQPSCARSERIAGHRIRTFQCPDGNCGEMSESGRFVRTTWKLPVI